jgi:hypothetical protein
MEAWGDAPDFVEVGEAGIAVDDAMRHQRRGSVVWLSPLTYEFPA